MWGMGYSREMGIFRSKVCNTDGTTTLKRGIYQTKEFGIDAGKDSVKVDSTGKKPVVEISPNADLGATVIGGWKDSDTTLNGNSLNEGGTVGSYTLSRGSAQNEDGSYSPAAVMIDFDLTGKDVGAHKKYGTGYTTCEEEYVGMSWDNWDGWDPLLEDNGTWDCDFPMLFPYEDLPTVSHDVAEENKK